MTREERFEHQYGRAVRTAATRLLPAMVETNSVLDVPLTVEEVADNTIDQAQALIDAFDDRGFQWMEDETPG